MAVHMTSSIHQIIPSIRSGDAVSQTALAMKTVLLSLGFESQIYRERCSPDLETDTLPVKDYLQVSAPENLVIYHYSTGSELGRFVYHLPDRLILHYHNISPPEDFIDIHNHVVGELYHGRKQVARLAGRCLLAAGGSEYNRKELDDMGFRNTMVLPYAIDFSNLEETPDPFIQESYSDHRFNFLFVGRIVPNKGIEDLIKLYAHYKKYVEHDSRLIIVGDWSGFERYRMQLLKLIADIDLPHVDMPGRVDFSQLLAFYSIADAYISLSRHEGFCIPLMEAMHFDIPVMALGQAAVPETLDGAGVMIHKLNYPEAAEMMDLLVRSGIVRERIIEGQRERLKRYHAIPFKDRVKSVIDRALEIAEENGQ
jgi:glycosyltransferase involved in cell wall biosynthesis